MVNLVGVIYSVLMSKAAVWLAILLWCTTGVHALPSVVRVAVGEGKPPYTFAHPAGGIQYDILSQIITRMGCRPDIVMVPLARAQAMLESGAIDGTLGTTGDFASQPFIAYQNAAISLHRRGLVIRSVGDLKNLRVVAFQNARIFLGREFQAMADANPQYQEVSPQVIANQLLFNGRADVVISDVHIFDYLTREVEFVDTTQPVAVHALFPPTRYRMIFREREVRDAFDKALKTVLSENPYPALVKKYLPNPIGSDFKP
jgi:polar amino acid transport system substrate-binding protein